MRRIEFGLLKHTSTRTADSCGSDEDKSGELGKRAKQNIKTRVERLGALGLIHMVDRALAA